MPLTHTYCEECGCCLRNNHAIEEHLKYSHGIQVRLETDKHKAYCKKCNQYFGTKGDKDPAFTLEKHLFVHHNINLHEKIEE